MEYDALMALIEDAGGYDNIARFEFDNANCVSFITAPQEAKLKSSDFKQLGGTWFYLEPAVFRSNDDYDYTVKGVVYHPLDCLQAVITCETPERLDIFGINDMINGNG